MRRSAIRKCMETVSWDHWRSFLAVIDEGSLSGAARALGLTQPTLGRHVDALERALGAALFLRVPSGLIATERAQALVPQARDMAGAAAALGRRAGETGGGGTVRLAASEIVGVEVLPPVLERFAAAHPAIGIELVLSNRNEDLLRHDADLAVRMVRPTQGALVARALGVVRLGLYAHRRYIDARGMPRDAAALADHATIGPDSARGLAGVKLGGRAVVPEMFRHRSDNDLAQLALLRAGAGIGICQAAIAARDADLVPVLPEAVQFSLHPWLVMHADLRSSGRVRLLWEHLGVALPPLFRAVAG